jgi:hypothetical protein
LVRFILGFGVGIGVGLAPYLGKLRIPFFAPLLSLIPDSLQDTIIPLSAALMGIIAVVTQWYGGERNSRKWFQKVFTRTLVALLLTFVALTVIHSLTVVRVPILGGKDTVSFLVGFTRPMKPPCTEDTSDSECIKRLTFDTTKIESFWGDRQVRIAKLALIFPYLSFMTEFGLLVGLILLRDETRK